MLLFISNKKYTFDYTHIKIKKKDNNEKNRHFLWPRERKRCQSS
jgi:hypothetical protein